MQNSRSHEYEKIQIAVRIVSELKVVKKEHKFLIGYLNKAMAHHVGDETPRPDDMATQAMKLVESGLLDEMPSERRSIIEEARTSKAAATVEWGFAQPEVLTQAVIESVEEVIEETPTSSSCGSLWRRFKDAGMLDD